MSASSDEPHPADFEVFLPWACKQLEVDENVIIKKMDLVEAVTSKSTPKRRSSRRDIDKKDSVMSDLDDEDILVSNAVLLTATRDRYGDLLKLDFDKRSKLPCKVMKLMYQALKYHENINTIVIKSKVDKYIMPELSKILFATTITELILDYTYCLEQNYYVLLDTDSALQKLSLVQCQINDTSIGLIADNLQHLKPASKTLKILILSQNMITDVGAKYLADMLRTNRQLYYIDLTGNKITDTGACKMFDTLLEFPLTYEEMIAAKRRHLDYLIARNELMQQTILVLKQNEDPSKGDRKLTSATKDKKTIPTNDKNKKRASIDSKKKVGRISKASVIYSSIEDQANAMVDEVIGPYNDPFFDGNVFAKEGIMYSKGNNVLCYLNLSFNDITFNTLTKIVKVLKYQSYENRIPRGLVQLVTHGNNLPVQCIENQEITQLLGYSALRSASISSKKRLTSIGGGERRMKPIPSMLQH